MASERISNAIVLVEQLRELDNVSIRHGQAITALVDELRRLDLTAEEFSALCWVHELVTDKVACTEKPFIVGVGNRALAALDKLLALGGEK